MLLNKSTTSTKELKVINSKEGKGSTSVLSKYQQKFLCRVIQWEDLSNGGIITKEVTEDMLVLDISLTINKSWEHYTNTLVVKYNYILIVKVKAQKTTTRWKVIMVPHKYRWHIQVENLFQFLRDNNTGSLPDGRTFGKVFKYFFLGGGETYFISS